MLSAIRRGFQKVTMSAMNSGIMYVGKSKHKRSKIGDEPYEMKGEIFTYRHGDWNDFVALYNAGGSALILQAFEDGGYPSSVMVTRNGSTMASSSRAYFFAFHNHRYPSGWAIYSHIDNYLITLGSWHVTYKIALVSPKFDGTNYRKGMFSVTDEAISYNADRTDAINSKIVEVF